MFDLDSYLARIALPSRVTVDADGLARLQWAHRLAIPFENLDVRLGRPIAIDSDSVFAKLVTGKRGGYCFEQNRLFLDALAAHGFSARPLLARVWLRATDVPPTISAKAGSRTSANMNAKTFFMYQENLQEKEFIPTGPGTRRPAAPRGDSPGRRVQSAADPVQGGMLKNADTAPAWRRRNRFPSTMHAAAHNEGTRA